MRTPVFALLLAVLFSLGMAQGQTPPPPASLPFFMKVGELWVVQRNGETIGQRYTIMEIRPDGWLKVKTAGLSMFRNCSEYWVNSAQIQVAAPGTP